MSNRKCKVYFIRAVNNESEVYGPINIRMSNNPNGILKNLQTSSQNKLEIIKTIQGGKKEEKEIYKKFKSARLKGEWFIPTKKLLRTIEVFNKPKQQTLESILNQDSITSYVNISHIFKNVKKEYIVLTKKLFKLGMSKNKSWSNKQLRLLGVELPKRKGWKKEIIGNKYHTSIIQQFLCIKNMHLKQDEITHSKPFKQSKPKKQINKAYEEIKSYDLSKIKIRKNK